MIRNIIIPITLTIALGTSASACSGGGSVPVESRQDLLFRADAPAPRWVESFPLGNGRIGMMSDGATGRETVVLNEISTWTGSKDDADNPMALDSLGRIRELLFAGRNDEAFELYYWFLPLLRLDIGTKFVQMIKLAVEYAGWGSSRVRGPRFELEGEERAIVMKIIEEGFASRPKLEELA